MYEISHNIVAQSKYNDDIKFLEFSVDNSGSNPYPILIRATYLDEKNKFYLPVDLEIFGFIFNQALLNCIVNAIDSTFTYDTVIDKEFLENNNAIDSNLINFANTIIRTGVEIIQVDDGAVLKLESFYAFTDDISSDITFKASKSLKITLTRFEIMQLIKFYSEFQKKMYG